MRPARDILHDGLILADGAMGTYFAQLSGRDTAGCELANLERPDLIRLIHRQYIAAGARFLRTNTFAAAALLGPSDPARLTAVVKAGYSIAGECAGDLAFVAADIGPVYNLEPDDAEAATLIVLDSFLSSGADLFMFETFADPGEVLPFCRRVRARAPEALIIASFALGADGYTRKGLSLTALADELDTQPAVDIWGINCGIGPTHLAGHVRRLPAAGKPLSLLPNNGYPRLENQRLIYGSSPEYFAQATLELAGSRTRLLGGCCGTTPRHIEAMRLAIDQKVPGAGHAADFEPIAAIQAGQPAVSRFAAKLERGAFVVACELDPPRDARMEPLIQAARLLGQAGVDLLTLADSPLARVKMDSIGCAARLYRETGLPAMPHMCCRDRNANSLRSGLLLAHSEGIRQILAVTGDAIPEADRGFVKPVFNMSSLGLLQLIRQMNSDFFQDDPLLAAAALDPGVANPKAELARCLKKQELGATVILTQPLFDLSSLELIRQVRASGLKVLIGLMPLLSCRNARYMSQEVPGFHIPPQILGRFSPDAAKEDAIAVGLQITREIAASVRPEADGFYLLAPFNRADLMVRLLNGLRQDRTL